jgi:hypothetical protein
MFRTFITSYKVSFAQAANTFIHFLTRLPLVGKKVPESLYRETQLKFALGVVYQIFRFFVGFFRKSLYLALMIALPAYLIAKDVDNLKPNFIHIFFFLSLVLAPLLYTVIFEQHNKPAYDMITLMRADAKEYYITEILFRRVEAFIHYLPPMIITGLLIGFSPTKAVVLLITLTALRLVGEFFQLYIYEKTGIVLAKNNYFVVILMLILLLLAYGLPIINLTINFEPIIFNIVIFLLFISHGAAALLYIVKYNKYSFLAKTLLTKENLFNIETFTADMTFADVKLDEKKMTQSAPSSNLYEEKHGYSYLNSLFFLRHRKIMITPIKIRTAIVALAFLITLGVTFIMPEHKHEIIESIKRSSPSLVFLMYLISTGERICKAMFFNCDIKMLRYGYYREKRVILSNFTLRLKNVVFLNLIPALSIVLALVIVVISAGYADELIGLIPLFFSVISLACFFSIHHLFLYYTIQPYTAELTVKSPLFKFINMAVWFLAYFSLQIKTTSVYFTLGVLIITVMYMIIAMIITYRVAHRTFKLK